jgi:hypothetical protein
MAKRMVSRDGCFGLIPSSVQAKIMVSSRLKLAAPDEVELAVGV